MDRDEGYRAIVEELEWLRSLPKDELIRLVGLGPIVKHIGPREAPIAIESLLYWSDTTQKAITVSTSAYGPSVWKCERIDEQITIELE